jgi:hypothetical protein
MPDSRGVAQPGSAPALGAGCRRFKSSRPDHDNSDIKVLKKSVDIEKLNKSLRKCHGFLIGLCKKLDLPIERLVIAPGNHDFRIYGNKFSKKKPRII